MRKICKFIMISGMLLVLNVACTGCESSKVSYVQAGDTVAGQSEENEENGQNVETEDAVNIVSETTEVLITDQGELSDADSANSQSDGLAVYVCGAVNVPGVYYFERGDIKSLALEAAGGFADGASTDYVNLAEKLQDGEKLYFPYEKEVETGDIKYDNLSGETLTSSVESSAQETAQSVSSGKININTADRTALMTLPGIGESKADLIINYRESNGAFNSIEDIMNINGIKEGVYSKIKDYISVEDVP